jgi:dihydroorotate dehydrogenase
MGFYQSVVRPLAFRFDPEWVHERAMAMIALGILRAPTVLDSRLQQTLFGVDFPHPLGLAAGFDKNALAVDYWDRLGFGHVEVGTVTHLAQPGNPRPRLFRLPDSKALINRMGFNNEGAAAVARRLASATPAIPVGVNLGKSRAVGVENAVEDYAASFRLLGSLGDWVTVNVSSPNTPGLRSLQEKAPLRDLLMTLRSMEASTPLFVKVSPDLELSALDDVLEVATAAGLTGIVATNTTLSREGVQSEEAGGLSGAPLLARSNEVLRHLAQARTGMVLIAAGGVFCAEDLYEKIALGAHLVQVYTGWVYRGPGMVAASLSGLLARMEREGLSSLAELRGASAC